MTTLPPRLAPYQPFLRCPSCKAAPTWQGGAFVCSCGKRYPASGGIPSFSGAPDQTFTAEHGFKSFFKRWPRLYRVLFYVVGPSLFTGLSGRGFGKRFTHGERVLHAGSGNLHLPQCLNVDYFPLPGVDLAADLRCLPFADKTFDAVACDQVLEHVPHPWEAAYELMRVTKTGGLIHVAMPFVFPWHPSPSDYTRWTQEGLRDLFAGCAVVEEGILAGPFSALVAFKAAFLATVLSLGWKPLQTVLQYVFLVLLAPLKLFDLLWAHLPGSALCAAGFYIVVRVPEKLPPSVCAA